MEHPGWRAEYGHPCAQSGQRAGEVAGRAQKARYPLPARAHRVIIKRSVGGPSMPKRTDQSVGVPVLKGSLWPDTPAFSPANSPQTATLFPMHAPGMVARPGSMYRDGMHADVQWHCHDMHQLSYAFEGAVAVE